MGKTAVVEEGLEYYGKALLALKKFTVGLIFGQDVNAQKAYVIHLSRTPEPLEEEEQEESEENAEPKSSTSKKKAAETVMNLDNFDEALIGDHARQVMRMLPGGISILGLFVVSPQEIFLTPATIGRLRKIMLVVDNSIKHPSITVRQPVSTEKLILHISSTSEKYTCKTMDVANTAPSVKPAEWKFQPAAGSPWIELHCNLNINFSVGFPSDEHTNMRSCVETALGSFNDSVKNSLCLVNGILRSETEPIDVVEKEKGGKRKQRQVADEERQKTMNIELLLPEVFGKVDKQKCLEEISFKGQMCVKAFVHGKATVGEAIEAVHEDIIRSMWARCDMHCDSLIGEDQRGEPDVRPVLHEPPRRVLAPLPCSPIPASDYLFPGEGPTDSLPSLAELLDLGALLEGDIQDYWEAVAETNEMLETEEVTAVKTEPVQAMETSNSNSIFILIAAVIALLAICIAYLYL